MRNGRVVGAFALIRAGSINIRRPRKPAHLRQALTHKMRARQFQLRRSARRIDVEAMQIGIVHHDVFQHAFQIAGRRVRHVVEIVQRIGQVRHRLS